MAQILCPNCRTNTVPAVSWNFTDTKVSVPVCDSCRASGLVEVTVKVTAMAELEMATFSVRHRYGIMEFAR